MSVEIETPFRINPDGHIAMVSEAIFQIDQHVRALVGTEPGERVIITDYGVALMSEVFEADDELVASRVSSRVQSSFARWEPNITVQSVVALPNTEGDGLAGIKVGYLRQDDPTISPNTSPQIQRASLKIGGQVQEVPIG